MKPAPILANAFLENFGIIFREPLRPDWSFGRGKLPGTQVVDGDSAEGLLSVREKMSSRVPATIHCLDHEVLCIIFVLLDIFDLVRCSAVCKSWNKIINKSKLLQILYQKQQVGSTGPSCSSNCSEKSLKVCIEQLVMERHRLSLQGFVNIEQWKGHPVRAGLCQMKMGLILTGAGDKVMRLWSLDSYRCLEEHLIPDSAPLVDFDFDENKIVGLIGTRICIWRRNGKRNIFPSREGTFMNGLCMRYIDPEAVVGCEDGAARVFDMYSRKCSRIIRMHSGPIRCLALSDDQCIISGSSLGNITVAGLSSDQQIAKLRPNDSTGIRTLCFNPCSRQVFAGSTAGYASCWDLRTMKPLWENRVCPNVIYSMKHLCRDTSTLVVGGIDGVLRILDQNTGKVASAYVMDDDSPTPPASSLQSGTIIERKKGRRITEDAVIYNIPKTSRPPITCLAVGMQKVVTTHNTKYIRMWNFHKEQTFQA